MSEPTKKAPPPHIRKDLAQIRSMLGRTLDRPSFWPQETPGTIWFGRVVPASPGQAAPQLAFGPADEQDGSVIIADRDGMTIFLSQDEALELASLIIRANPLDALGQL